MINIVLFDIDGVVVKRDIYFSKHYSSDFGVPWDDVMVFFNNEFKMCLVGKADLKIEVAKYLPKWGWEGSVEEFLEYWFKSESEMDENLLRNVKRLRENGVKCFLATNNEKYRTEYLWNDLDLKSRFDGIFSSVEIGHKKGELEYWQKVDQKLGKPEKGRVLLWDNDEKNIARAKELGYRAEFYTTFESYQNKMREFVKN